MVSPSLSKVLPEQIKSTCETITPQQASVMLGSNTHNRNLKTSVVERYMRDMQAGKWMVNGESISISTEGVLLNGQHRLTACVRSGVTFRTMVVRNVSPEAFHTIDQNIPRNHADVLGISGDIWGGLRSSIERGAGVVVEMGAPANGQDVEANYPGAGFRSRTPSAGTEFYQDHQPSGS